MPIATATGVPSPSIRIPASFFPRNRTSFGHFNANGGSALATARMASQTASPATNDNCDANAAGAGSVIKSVAKRLPGAETQARPRRPRPAVWARAVSQSGPVSPARARASASELVELTTSHAMRRTGAASPKGIRSRPAPTAPASAPVDLVDDKGPLTLPASASGSIRTAIWPRRPQHSPADLAQQRTAG